MLALSVALIVVSASPTKLYRERTVDRAARLMTNEERAQLESFNVQLADLHHRPAQSSALMAGSIITLSVAGVVPVAMAAVGILGTFFAGLLGFAAPSLWTGIPAMWLTLFSWIPVWGWIAIGVGAVAGAAMLWGALAADAPRRAKVQSISEERRRLVIIASSRPELPESAPPLVTF